MDQEETDTRFREIVAQWDHYQLERHRRREALRRGFYRGYLLGHIVALPIVAVFLLGHFRGWW